MQLQNLYFLPFVIASLNAASQSKRRESTPRKHTDRQNEADDVSLEKAVCMPMMFHRVVTPEMTAKVRDFQKDWKDTKRFPALTLTAKEATWLQSLSVESSTRLSHGRVANITRLKGTNGKGCYEIPAPMRERKEYRQLTTEERQSFHEALNVLKSFLPDPEGALGVSGYDIIVGLHRYESASAAHGGAAFLPWHREFLLRMENALYDSGYTGPGLPYWDSTLDQSLPDPSHSAFFSADYMGNNDGQVTSGPAANWTTIDSCHSRGQYVTRSTRGGSAGQSYLYNDAAIQTNVFDKGCFKDIVCDEDCEFEYDHGAVHVFVNGHMGMVTCSPSDPIFFLHHTFVDYIWEEFRQNHQGTSLEREYPSKVANDDAIGWGAHEWDDPMKPFDGLINAHGISKHYTNYYYKYAARPSRCIASYQCGSEALWCDRRACRCRAKVRLGGHCGSLPHMACAGACSKGKTPKCRDSICVC